MQKSKKRKRELGQKAGGSRQFLTGPALCERYNFSDMSLYRWLADEKVGFPQPAMRVNGRRYWREADLIAWEKQRIARTANPSEAA